MDPVGCSGVCVQMKHESLHGSAETASVTEHPIQMAKDHKGRVSGIDRVLKLDSFSLTLSVFNVVIECKQSECIILNE